MVGKTLGHYEILAPLGEGGMGQVYRARDTTLDRDVAIKVLPEDFASDANRLARFEREAKLLASLNHPNIATIHGFDESDGVRFIAMELVEGQSLAERIEASGRIDVDEALEIARRIALALEAAHEAGVIHRDLKPANVQVAPDGTVKVLDFGLAKAYAADGSEPSSDLSHSPTMMAATGTGVIMGTAPYMCPEQARGQPVDKRSDIWSFGCVLYEMLVGKRAFDGKTVSDTMAAILKEEPDWASLPAATPLSCPSHQCMDERDPYVRLLRELTPDPVERALVQIEADTALAEVRLAALACRRGECATIRSCGEVGACERCEGSGDNAAGCRPNHLQPEAAPRPRLPLDDLRELWPALAHARHRPQRHQAEWLLTLSVPRLAQAAA